MNAELLDAFLAGVVDAAIYSDDPAVFGRANELLANPEQVEDIVRSMVSKLEQKNKSLTVPPSPFRNRNKALSPEDREKEKESKRDLRQREKAVEKIVEEVWSSWVRLPGYSDYEKIAEFDQLATLLAHAQDKIQSHDLSASRRRNMCGQLKRQVVAVLSRLSTMAVDPSEANDHRRVVEGVRKIGAMINQIDFALVHLSEHPKAVR